MVEGLRMHKILKRMYKVSYFSLRFGYTTRLVDTHTHNCVYILTGNYRYNSNKYDA